MGASECSGWVFDAHSGFACPHSFASRHRGNGNREVFLRSLCWLRLNFSGGFVRRKKNRASQSGGDRKARGIFELSTTVGLRRTSAPICTRNRDRNRHRAYKEQTANMPEKNSKLA